MLFCVMLVIAVTGLVLGGIFLAVHKNSHSVSVFRTLTHVSIGREPNVAKGFFRHWFKAIVIAERSLDVDGSVLNGGKPQFPQNVRSQTTQWDRLKPVGTIACPELFNLKI